MKFWESEFKVPHPDNVIIINSFWDILPGMSICVENRWWVVDHHDVSGAHLLHFASNNKVIRGLLTRHHFCELKSIEAMV